MTYKKIFVNSKIKILLLLGVLTLFVVITLKCNFKERFIVLSNVFSNTSTWNACKNYKLSYLFNFPNSHRVVLGPLTDTQNACNEPVTTLESDLFDNRANYSGYLFIFEFDPMGKSVSEKCIKDKNCLDIFAKYVSAPETKKKDSIIIGGKVVPGFAYVRENPLYDQDVRYYVDEQQGHMIVFSTVINGKIGFVDKWLLKKLYTKIFSTFRFVD